MHHGRGDSMALGGCYCFSTPTAPPPRSQVLAQVGSLSDSSAPLSVPSLIGPHGKGMKGNAHENPSCLNPCGCCGRE